MKWGCIESLASCLSMAGVIHSIHEHFEQTAATALMGPLVAFVHTIPGPSALRNGPFVLGQSGLNGFEKFGSNEWLTN